MALKMSTGLKTAMMGTKGFIEIFTGGTFRLMSGDSPGADVGVTGINLLSVVPTWTSKGTGIATMDVTVGTALSDGTVGYFRLCDVNDNPLANSSTACRVDGECGFDPADMIFGTLGLTKGQVISVRGDFKIP